MDRVERTTTDYAGNQWERDLLLLPLFILFFISLFFIPQSLNFILLSPLFQIFGHFFSIYINHLLLHYILYYYTILSDKMFCVFYEYRSFSEAFLQKDAILLSFSICNVSSLILYFYLDTVYYRVLSLLFSFCLSFSLSYFFFLFYYIMYNIFSLYIYPSFFPFPSETLVTRYFYLRLINVRLSFSIFFVRQFPLSFLELVLPLRGGYPLALSFYPFSSRHISP